MPIRKLTAVLMAIGVALAFTTIPQDAWSAGANTAFLAGGLLVLVAAVFLASLQR